MQKIDIWLPIPLHKNRLKNREYNQSAILLKAMKKIYEKRMICSTDIVKRVIDNERQATLTKAERLRNVDSIFAINPRYKDSLQGKCVAILDDVVTTGATMEECAKMLCIHCKVGKVLGISLAKT
jgi:ComF family protein